MKKTLFALTTLVAAIAGFQVQAQAGHAHRPASGIQFGVKIGDGFGIRYGSEHHYHHYKYKRVHRKKYYNPRPYRCGIAGKRSIRRSLRDRGFYDISRLHKYGKIYSAKAISPRGHLVKLKINGCNYRIIKRKVLRPYPTVWSRGNTWRTYW